MSDSTEAHIPDPEAIDAQADHIIKKHMALGIAAGVIPMPFVDLAAVTAVQLDMLKQLAATYGVAFDARSARSFVTSLTSALAGATAARLGASVVKLVPGIGTLAGGVAQAVITGASTYAVGRLFTRLFREGRSIDDLTVDAVREEVMSYFEAGKGVARAMADELKRRASSIRSRDHAGDED